MMLRAVAFVALTAALAFATYDTSRVSFEEFKAKFGKSYASHTAHEAAFKNFVDNAQHARAHQKRNPEAVFGATKFADLSEAEFGRLVRSSATKRKPVPRKEKNPLVGSATIFKGQPKKVDWVTMGAVTAVKNMGECGGGCVGFAVAGAAEGANFVTNKRLVSLSAGEIVECAMPDGCDGGEPMEVIDWFLNNTNGAIATAKTYPYNSSDGSTGACQLGKIKIEVGARIKSVIKVPKHESAIASTLAQYGPMSISVDALSWQTYMGGVLTSCSASQIDTDVLLVGYDEEAKIPYWLIKNAWGADWGEEGYIRVKKGIDACGITDDPIAITASTIV